MPKSEKDKSILKSFDYKISGNTLRAFYDKHRKLVFVLDSTINKLKPNVLLVMSSYGDRKWDDVLSNDYGMNLELIRPKKDNKYQKLDIDYDGLVVYDNLIRADQDGGDVKSALRDLNDFRAMSVRRSAQERLETSTAIAEKTRETINRTNETIEDLEEKIKSVRSKLATLRRGVGKVPPKQSAAKILKAEAQLDVLTGKLERAQKRLENANKRLLIAEDDIDAARKVLDLVPPVRNAKFQTVETKPTEEEPEEEPEEESSTDEDEESDEGDDDDWWHDDDDDKDNEEKDDDKDDEPVKPLFDKDPNILDDNIAFKPISFDENLLQQVSEPEPEPEPEPVKQEQPAISFEPPQSVMDAVKVPNDNNEKSDVKLDNIFDESADIAADYNADSEKEDSILNSQYEDTESDKDPDIVFNPMTEEDVSLPADEEPLNIKPVVPAARPALPASAPKPPFTVSDIPKVGNQQHKPNLLYYVLLLVLIALSVFTLWLYQRSNVSPEAVPELVATETMPVQQPQPVTDVAIPVPDEPTTIAPNTDVSVDDEDPFVVSDTPVVQPEPVTIGSVVQESLDKIAQAAKTENEDEPVKNTVSETKPDAAQDALVVNKPEYKVTTEKVFTSGSGSLCDGNVAPDANGCCPGEVYSVVDGQNVCCPSDGQDCFPPMF